MEPLELFLETFKPVAQQSDADYFLSTDEIIEILKDLSGRKIDKEPLFNRLLEEGFVPIAADEVNTFKYKFLIKRS